MNTVTTVEPPKRWQRKIHFFFNVYCKIMIKGLFSVLFCCVLNMLGKIKVYHCWPPKNVCCLAVMLTLWLQCFLGHWFGTSVQMRKSVHIPSQIIKARLTFTTRNQYFQKKKSMTAFIVLLLYIYFQVIIIFMVIG